MALKKKLPKLLTLGADILVIQECSRSDIKQLGQTIDFSSTWFGKNKNKGLGVLAKSPWVIREARALKPKWAAKLVIGGPASIELYPIWACTSKRPAKRYIEHVHFLLDVMEQTPLSQLAIVAGDFNLTPWSFALKGIDRRLGLERWDRALFSWPARMSPHSPLSWPTPFLPIDHLYAGRDWRVVSLSRGPLVGSDHYPIVARLALTP